MLSLPPGVLLLLGGLLSLLPLRGRVGHRFGQAVLLLAPVLSALHVLSLPPGTETACRLFDLPLAPLRVDALSRFWGILFHLGAFAAALYTLPLRDRIQRAAALAYAGAAVGAVYAGDLLTLFLYWELTAVTSVILVWATRSEPAVGAGLRYLIYQVGSGVLLLSGALLHYHATGSLSFGSLALDSPGVPLILLAFGIKCAFPLLHTWLLDAYSKATPTGVVWLSVFTTKLAIYALLRGFAGTHGLIPLGLWMAIVPLLYAVLETDLRRMVLHALMSQLGFMVVAIGIGTPLAINGAAAHAFCGVFYIALLLMALGVAESSVGSTEASAVAGLHRVLPWTVGFCLVGAASISAVPLFCGFASKSLILSAAGEEHLLRTWLLLLLASAGTVLTAGFRVPSAFFAKGPAPAAQADSPLHHRGMMLTAVLCLGLGVFPSLLYRLLPYEMEYRLFTAAHVVSQLQLVAWAGLAFLGLRAMRLLPRERAGTLLDVDWFYRRAFPEVANFIGGAVVTAWLAMLQGLRGGLALLARWAQVLHAPQGVFGRTWTTGTMVLFAAVFLCLYLLVYTLWR